MTFGDSKVYGHTRLVSISISLHECIYASFAAQKKSNSLGAKTIIVSIGKRYSVLYLTTMHERQGTVVAVSGNLPTKRHRFDVLHLNAKAWYNLQSAWQKT